LQLRFVIHGIIQELTPHVKEGNIVQDVQRLSLYIAVW
jgi:hypothetical protein